MAKEARIVSAPLSAEAYGRGRKLPSIKAAQIHAVEVDDQDDPVSVLCGKVKAISVLADSSEYNRYPVTCPRCRRLLPPR